EVREKAESVTGQIRDGEITFAAAVKKWSKNENAVLSPNELQFIEESNLDPAFARAISSLEKGEVSNPIPTSKGFEVVKLVESIPEKLLPLEEVRDKIDLRIRKEKSSNFAFDLADDVLAQAETSEISLKDAALAKDLKVILTKPFSRGQLGQNQGVPVVLLERAFGTEEGDLSDIYEDGGKLYLFQTVERKESYLPEFDVVKDEVTGGFLIKKALQKAEDTGEEFLEQLEAGKSLRSLAGENGLKVMTTPFFIAVDTTLSGLMEPQKLIREAFTLKGAGASSLVRGDRVHYVIVFNEERPADEEAATDLRKSIEEAVRLQKEQDIFLDYIATMKSKLADKIVINKDII
ncbi:MAG: peptidylprolyl isomerase, partial [bacterium]